jgi:hypothetical protein
MKSSVLCISVAVSAQYLSIILGVSWGFAIVQRRSIERIPLSWTLDYILDPLRFGSLTVLILCINFLLIVSKRDSRSLHGQCWVSLSLVSLALWTIYSDPLIGYHGTMSFVIAVFWIMPWLMSINVLARGRAWLGVVGCVLFASELLCLFVHNACSPGSAFGFFYREIS